MICHDTWAWGILINKGGDGMHGGMVGMSKGAGLRTQGHNAIPFRLELFFLTQKVLNVLNGTKDNVCLRMGLPGLHQGDTFI